MEDSTGVSSATSSSSTAAGLASLSRPQMKIKVISRSKLDYVRQSDKDMHKVQRNFDPRLHPFEKAIEYTRALNATKLDKVFAKPFVFALNEHRDSVFCMSSRVGSLVQLYSGACDGELKLWNLAFKSCLWSVKAHSGFVRGCVSTLDGANVLTCGDDKTIKMWKPTEQSIDAFGGGDRHIRKSKDEDDETSSNSFLTRARPGQPLQTYMGQHAFTAIDHQHGTGSTTFATAGVQLDLWDHERSDPLHSFSWGADSISCVKFNPVEHQVLVSAASDRNLVLYDIRTRSPLRKLIMQMNTNAIAWNPMEAFNFTIANEDHNCYTFDMRKLKSALCVHMDHVSAVMALDYSPTGREFVTGGYDRTVRIFPSNEGRSREVYHTKRMQRIFTVKYSGDAKYVLSGSDDTNIRVWKAQASMPIKPLVGREKAKLNYANKLKERFKNAPEILRIARHRHVPKAILSAGRTKTEIKRAEDQKAARVRAHTKPGTLPFVPERKKHILTEVE